MLFVFKVLRLIFITIDNAIFELVDLLYQLFMLLAETGIFTTEAIRAFSERIYFFLGLIMVFKVSISLIQYILNPDAVNDGKIGAPKLLKNIVFVLVGIIAVPYIFDAAFSLQRIILKDNIIGNLILGTNLSGKGKNAESVVKETGDIMAFSTFTAFLHFNDDYITSECAAQPFDITEGNNRYATASSVCVGENSKNSQEVKDMLNEFYDSKAGGLYREAYENNNMHKIAGHMKVYNYTFEDSEGDDTFLFDYMLLITTGGGVFLAYVLLIFCFDVAVRAVKLGFLQLIAPIPLIAKIDPKKGDEVFNKWVKECTSTYLNLFVRLVAIYFALYIITLVGSTGKPYNVVTKKDINNPFVYVFIIFGVLLFVKDLPKLIETLTGMKINTGGFGLKNKLGQVPLVGGKLANKLAQAEGHARGRARQFMQNKGGNLAKRLAGQKNPNSRYSTALNKMANSNFGKTIGLDNRIKELGAKGEYMRATSKKAYDDRVNAGLREGMEREKSAGWFGDSGYKGNTIGKTLAQAKYKEKESKLDGDAARTKMAFNYSRGEQGAAGVAEALGITAKDSDGNWIEAAKKELFSKFDPDAKGNMNRAAYEAVYQSGEFISALMSYNKADANLKAVKKEYDVAVSAGKLTDELQEKYEKAVKTASGKEETLKTMRASYPQDAETEAALKFFKNNDEDPTGYSNIKTVGAGGSSGSGGSGGSGGTGGTSGSGGTGGSGGSGSSGGQTINYQQIINNTNGVGYNASDHGAPTADNSLMRDISAEDYFRQSNGITSGGNINGANGNNGPVNATISPETMMQMAQIMGETYSQSAATAMKDAMKDMGKQLSQDIGNSVKDAVAEPFNKLNQNVANMNDSLAQVERRQKNMAEIIDDNTEAIEEQNKPSDDEQ